MRINNSVNEFTRMPKIVIINIDANGINIQEKNIKCALPGNEVLDRFKVEAFAFKEKNLQNLFKVFILQANMIHLI